MHAEQGRRQCNGQPFRHPTLFPRSSQVLAVKIDTEGLQTRAALDMETVREYAEAEAERGAVRRALARNGGNVSAAARALGSGESVTEAACLSAVAVAPAPPPWTAPRA